MILRRRGFLTLFGASAAIIAADRLMPVRSPPILLYGDQLHNDSPAIKAIIDGKRVWDVVRKQWMQARDNQIYVPPGHYLIGNQIILDKDTTDIDFAGSRLDASQMQDGKAVFKIAADGIALRNAAVYGTIASPLSTFPRSQVRYARPTHDYSPFDLVPRKM